MNIVVLLFGLLVVAIGLVSGKVSGVPPRTVEQLNVDQYLGRWYYYNDVYADETYLC